MAPEDSHVKRRRARTGCLKCRTRRRKCDEEKPRCRNCRTGGHQCQYGTRLSFLEKNAITVSAPLTSPAPSGSSYLNLQFVEPAVEVQGSSSKDSPTATTTAGEILASPSSTLPEYGGLHFGESDQGHVTDEPSPSLPFAGFASQGRLPRHDAHIDSAYEPAKAIETSPGAGAYQSALDGLLSLGTDGQPQQSRVQHSNNLNQGAEKAPSPSEHLQVAFEPFVTCRHAPQDSRVALLRHYVYNIAPWLDTGDPNRTFRIRVSQISQTSQAVLKSLLALSSSSLVLKSRQAHGQALNFEEAQNPVFIASSMEAVAMALVCVRRFILTAPFQWTIPQPLSRLNPVNFVMPEEKVELSLSVSWLVLRMNLSRGLMHNEPVTVPNLLLDTVTTPSGRGWSRDLLDYDRQPLLFCARALNFCFSRDSGGQSSGPRGRVEAWKEISNSLDLWYLNRPQDFRPILDSGKSDSLFPLILFTNPAAVMANQMYHAAMLLLLQYRPRTLRTEAGRSAGSPLRHAQRVCGISLSNSDPNGWDFSLVASLCTAARKMTYVPQQEAILSKLKQVSDLTGWNLTGLEPHLRQNWNHE